MKGVSTIGKMGVHDGYIIEAFVNKCGLIKIKQG